MEARLEFAVFVRNSVFSVFFGFTDDFAAVDGRDPSSFFLSASIWLRRAGDRGRRERRVRHAKFHGNRILSDAGLKETLSKDAVTSHLLAR